AQAPGRFHGLVGGRPFGLDDGDTLFFLFGRQAAVGPDNVNLLFDAAAQNDVGTPTRHVGGNGNVPRLAGFGHDFGFAGVLLGIQDFVLELGFVKHARQELGVLDAGRAHQDGLATLVAIADVSQDCVVFLGIGLEYLVVLVDTGHRPVRRDNDRFQ